MILLSHKLCILDDQNQDPQKVNLKSTCNPTLHMPSLLSAWPSKEVKYLTSLMDTHDFKQKNME